MKRKVGRPKTGRQQEHYNVSLDKETVEKARAIGDGNLSNGLRIALKHVSVPIVLSGTN